MKIAIVTDAWHPQINGVVTTYRQTIRELAAMDHQVLTITPHAFATVSCPTYPEVALALARPKHLRNMLAAYAPEAIHIATEGPLGWAARNVCLAARFPFTTAYHTRFPEYVRLRVPIPTSLLYAIIRRFHNRAARIMASTDSLCTELTDKGFKNVVRWSRGVDTALFSPVTRLDKAGSEPILTYVGRVAPEKNIEAFLTLDHPGKKCVIGDGPVLAELKQRYPAVLFTGYKQGKDLADCIGASSVLVFPSLTDTFGIVQLEAMSCGVPVAAFPVEGPRSIIVNGLNGWMDNNLAEAVSKCLLLDRDRCRHFALGHSWQTSTKQFINNLMCSNKAL